SFHTRDPPTRGRDDSSRRLHLCSIHTSRTRSRLPTRAVILSPRWIGVDGFASTPLTLTCPHLHSSVDAERVRVTRTAHSHLSIRPTSTSQACHERTEIGAPKRGCL